MIFGQATGLAGCFLHEDQPIADAEVAALLGPGSSPTIEVRGRLHLAVRGRSTEAASHDTILIGRLGPRAALDRALHTEGQPAERLIEAAYLTWGDGAWLRLAGQFAALHYDEEDAQLHLIRSPGPASPPLYVIREGRRTYFASQLAPLVGAKHPVDRALLDRWVETGVWPEPERTPFKDIEIVAPGTALVLEARGRNRRHRFWTFSPLAVPRRLPEVAARRELESSLEASIKAAGLGQGSLVDADPPALEVLGRLGRATIPSVATTTLATLAELARTAEGPLPRSALERAARLPAGRPIVVDRGAAACFGASPSARAALFSTLAQALELNPSPRLLRQVLGEGVAIGQTRMLPELAGVAERVFDRWRRHLPPEVNRRLGWLPPPREAPQHSPVLTGAPFIDRRFHEIADRTLEVELGLLGARGPLAAPFADPAVIELLFQIPPEMLTRGGRAYALLGGVPFSSLRDRTQERDDRAAGLGLYLAAIG